MRPKSVKNRLLTILTRSLHTLERKTEPFSQINLVSKAKEIRDNQ